MGVQKRHELNRHADATTAGIGHRSRQPVLVGGLAHLAQYMPMRESANDGGVFGRKLGYNVLDPGQHPFDADVDRAQNADRDQEAAQVIVGSVRGKIAEGVVADFTRSAGHVAKELRAGTGLLSQQATRAPSVGGRR
ncbi:hypothetical protein [Mycolicibacterium litorale]|nr:hypothetical protein [Mycolicibacterium litorale]